MPTCSELNVKHDGEDFVSMRVMVFEILTGKLKKLRISLTIWHLNSHNLVKFWPSAKMHQSRVLIKKKKFADLFRLGLPPILWKREGTGVAPTPFGAVEDGEMASAGER